MRSSPAPAPEVVEVQRRHGLQDRKLLHQELEDHHHPLHARGHLEHVPLVPDLRGTGSWVRLSRCGAALWVPAEARPQLETGLEPALAGPSCVGEASTNSDPFSFFKNRDDMEARWKGIPEHHFHCFQHKFLF